MLMKKPTRKSAKPTKAKAARGQLHHLKPQEFVGLPKYEMLALEPAADMDAIQPRKKDALTRLQLQCINMAIPLLAKTGALLRLASRAVAGDGATKQRRMSLEVLKEASHEAQGVMARVERMARRARR